MNDRARRGSKRSNCDSFRGDRFEDTRPSHVGHYGFSCIVPNFVPVPISSWFSSIHIHIFHTHIYRNTHTHSYLSNDRCRMKCVMRRSAELGGRSARERKPMMKEMERSEFFSFFFLSFFFFVYVCVRRFLIKTNLEILLDSRRKDLEFKKV